MNKLMAIVITFAVMAYAAPAYACNDPHHGHPVGHQCDRDIQAQGQVQGQTQNQQNTANVDTASTSNSNAVSGSTSQSGSTSNSSSSTGPITTTASGGNSASTANAEGGTGGNSSLENSGNGGGAVVNSTSVSNSETLVFSPVQAPALPPTITVGGVVLQKVGECGRRMKIHPFERTRRTPQLLGLVQTSERVETMHGLLEGFDPELPFVVDEVTIPAPINKKVVTVYGHQLYLTVGQDGQGGGSSGAANYGSTERAMGAGASLSSNSSLGVVGVVAVPCVYDPEAALRPTYLKVAMFDSATTKPERPTSPTDLRVETTEVPGTKGHWEKVKDRKTNPCGAGEGEKCVFVRDPVKVVTGAKLDPSCKQ